MSTNSPEDIRIADLQAQIEKIDAQIAPLAQRRDDLIDALNDARSEKACRLVEQALDSTEDTAAGAALVEAVALDATDFSRSALASAITELHSTFASYTRWWPNPSGTGLRADADAWPLLTVDISLYTRYSQTRPADVDPASLALAIETFQRRFCPDVPLDAAAAPEGVHSGRMPMAIYEDAEFEDRRLTLWVPTDASRHLEGAAGDEALLIDCPSGWGPRTETLVARGPLLSVIETLIAVVQTAPQN